MVGGGGRAQQWDMPSSPVTSQTQVAIVGGGPAGADAVPPALPSRASTPSSSTCAAARRSRTTHRAGILEQDTVDLLVETGVSDRVLARRPRARGHRARASAAQATASTSRAWSGRRAGSTRRPTCSSTSPTRASATAETCGSASPTSSVDDLAARPVVRFTDADGRAHEVRADFVVGADGSRSVVPPRGARGGATAVLPRVPVRLVRDPCRGAAERPGADLQPLDRTGSR